MRNKNAKVSDPNSFVTDPGSEERIIYEAKVQSDGSIKVVPSGKENIQDKIESFRSGTDMAFILKQLALGNNEVIAQTPGQYGDFTHMPKTMAEAMQMQIDAEREFYKLPLDVRGKFENDFRRWLVDVGSEDWIKKMGFVSAQDDVKGENESSAAE